MQLRERRDLVLDAGRRLGMDHRDEPSVPMLTMRIEEAMRVDRMTPRLLDTHDLGAAATRDLAHPLTEHAVDADNGLVARLDEVDEARLHAGGAGAADRQRQRVRGPKDRAQAIADLVEHREEVWIEVPEHRSLERFHDLGIRVRRPGPEQEPLRMHGA